MTQTTTWQRFNRLDHRQRRAQSVAHEVFRVVDPFLHPEADGRDVMRAIMDVLMREGVEVLTDYYRQEMGLPPRGPDGWTVEEIVAFERAMIERMIAPLPPMFIEKKP